MATMNRNEGNVGMEGQRGGQQQGNVQGGLGQGVGSPISNEAYNVITALQAKLEGLEAYRKYQKDGGSSIWQELSQADIQCVTTLVDELENLVKGGKLRSQISGGTKS